MINMYNLLVAILQAYNFQLQLILVVWINNKHLTVQAVRLTREICWPQCDGTWEILDIFRAYILQW